MKQIAIGHLSPAIGQKLIELGIPDVNACSRIVIDMKADEVVKVYYETFAEQESLEKALDVLLELKATDAGE